MTFLLHKLCLDKTVKLISVLINSKSTTKIIYVKNKSIFILICVLRYSNLF